MGSDSDKERTFSDWSQESAYVRVLVLRSTVQWPTSSPFIQMPRAELTRSPF